MSQNMGLDCLLVARLIYISGIPQKIQWHVFLLAYGGLASHQLLQRLVACKLVLGN